MGGSFDDITIKLFDFGGYTVNMTLKWLNYGKIGYFFTMNCKKDKETFKEAKAVDIVPVLQPMFKIASNINTATEIIAAISVVVATLLTPWSGDEVVALAALKALFANLKPAF